MQKSIAFTYSSDLSYTFHKQTPQYGDSKDILVDIIRPVYDTTITVRLSTLEQIVKDGQRLRAIWSDH